MYFKGTSTKSLILKIDTENGIYRYVDTDFAIGWNQYEVTDPRLVLSKTDYMIMHANCLIIWDIWKQIEIVLGNK